MPINLGVQVKPISHDDFHTLDYEVMGIVFSIHRDLGRFWNEKICQNELAYRCQKFGFKNTATEVPIHVSYRDFSKIYYIDPVINNAIYELKTTQSLAGEHVKQTINYLMLTGLNHAKLINLRPPSVQHRFVSTNLTPAQRYDFMVDDVQWRELDEDSIWLNRMFKSLIEEWGLFLEVSLFYEAIVHFRGGEEKVVRKIGVRDRLENVNAGPRAYRTLGSECIYGLVSLFVHKSIGTPGTKHAQSRKFQANSFALLKRNRNHDSAQNHVAACDGRASL